MLLWGLVIRIWLLGIFLGCVVEVYEGYGVWLLWSVAVMVCGCYGVWLLWCVAVMACGCYGVWLLGWSVALVYDFHVGWSS